MKHHKSPDRPKLSKAILRIARNNLKTYARQADAAFLVRADMDRKLSLL